MKRYIRSSTDIVQFLNKYYEYYNTDKLAERYKNDILELLENYKGTHYITSLVAKKEFQDILDAYYTVDVFSEDGRLFLGQFVSDRLYDVTNEVNDALKRI